MEIPRRDFWNTRVPTPVKWVLCGAVLWVILRSGAFQPLTAGGVIGGLAYLVYRTFFMQSATNNFTNGATQVAEVSAPIAAVRA